MKELLIEKLHLYLRENNPDVLLDLEENGKVTDYLFNKINSADALLKQYDKHPEYIIEEVCMEVLTRDLRPSRCNYILTILEEEFENSNPILFEVINILGYCKDVFDTIGFTEENEDSRELRYAITGTMSEYLETVKSELQQTTKIIG